MSGAPASTRAELDPLRERSAAAQEDLAQWRQQYGHRTDDAPLPPGVIHEIRKATRRYLDLQEALVAFVQRTRAAAQDLDGVTVALGAATQLYDNYLAMLPLLADRHYRRLVNHVDLGYGIRKNELWDIVEALNDRHSRRALVGLMDRWDALRKAPGAEVDETLATAIEGSASWFLVRNGELDRHLPTAMLVRRERILDGLAQLGNDALYLVSEGFGNAVGLVEFRKGKLWQREDVLGHLHKVLRPLDLLLEKTPFRLTDFLIPGHFGHVAIWMGRPHKLKRLRVWDQDGLQQPKFQACRPMIEEGRGVLEALRSGVELNPLRVFANVDDLLILRPRRRGRRKTVECLVRGFQQIGKEYDFNFDVETTDTIVCSELPYHVFPDVDWDTDEQLGRFTISPDDIARQALGPKPDFRPIAFYHDGALVPDREARARLQSFVEPDAS